ncbi:MAG: hypothetical protein ACI841_005147 [Planctomycetota bacterium]|jgi:hypothetical protein
MVSRPLLPLPAAELLHERERLEDEVRCPVAEGRAQMRGSSPWDSEGPLTSSSPSYPIKPRRRQRGRTRAAPPLDGTVLSSSTNYLNPVSTELGEGHAHAEVAKLLFRVHSRGLRLCGRCIILESVREARLSRRKSLAPIWHQAVTPLLALHCANALTPDHHARKSAAAEGARTVDIQLGKLSLVERTLRPFRGQATWHKTTTGSPARAGLSRQSPQMTHKKRPEFAAIGHDPISGQAGLQTLAPYGEHDEGDS